jgi:predicted homoserine dehydrogenase-like protein
MAEGARAKHAIPKDHAITFDDVELAPRRINDLFDEQLKHFGTQV